MPSFDNIGVGEPSTITAVVATVAITRGSTTEQQEILVLGDSETSNALARVLNATPASTTWALAVREVAPSTTVAVSTGSVRVHQSTQAKLLATIYQSTAADLNVTVAGYVAPSTTVTVSTGSVRVHQSTQADLRATMYQSTAADLNVTVAGYVAPSTTVSVSTGSVRVHQSTAADLNVTVAGYSTIAAVSSVSGRVAFAGYHAGGSIVNVTDSTNNAINVNVVAGAAGGSTIYTMSRVLSTSGDQVTVGDTANSAIRVNVVAGAAGGSTEITVRQSTVGALRAAVYQSTAADLNVTVAGYVAPSTTVTVSSVGGIVKNHIVDRDSSTQVAAVLNAEPPSTTWALAVRTIGGGPPTGLIDVFSRLTIGIPTNQVDVQFYRSSTLADLVTVTSSNGGTATSSNGAGVFETGTASSGAVTAVTFGRTRYTAGSEMWALFTAAFTTPSTANQFERIGLFDSSNGFFLGYESTAGFSITRRAGGSDSNVLISAFNQDLLNGNSTSAFTRDGAPEALNPTKLNIYRVRFGWLGAAPVHWEVFSPDGVWVPFHTYSWPNSTTLGTIYGADLPMRVEARKVNAGADSLVIRSLCWGAGTNHDLRPINEQLSTQMLAPVVRSVITGENSSVAGSFVNVKVTTAGAVTVDGTISSIAGAVVVRSTAAEFGARVYQSTAADLNVTVAGYVAPSTTVSVSTGSVRVHQSTAADLNVTVAGYSTTVNVSSLAGRVAMAGQHASEGVINVADSTNNALRVNVVAGAAGGSTLQTISAVLSTSGDTVTIGDTANAAIRVNVVAGAAGGSTVYTLSRVQSTSGDPVTIGDTANSAIRVNVVAGAVAGSTEVTIRQSTAADLRATIYQSTAADLNVTVAGYVAPSTTVTVSTGSIRVHQSTQADFRATIYQSTAADLNVTVAGYVAPSTTVTVARIIGNSSAVDYMSVRIVDSSGTGFLTPSPQYTDGSTVSTLAAPSLTYRNSSNDTMRMVGMGTPLPVQEIASAWDSTCASGTKATSGDTVILSSAASTRWAVFGYAFSLASTIQTTVRLVSSGASTVEMARWLFQAPSSIAVGANMAVPMPAYLCQGAATAAIVLNTDSTATVHYTVWAYRKS